MLLNILKGSVKLDFYKICHLRVKDRKLRQIGRLFQYYINIINNSLIVNLL